MTDVLRFRGRTPALAMRKARDELGDDARLVSAQRVSGPGLPPLYEVQVTRGPVEAAGGVPELKRELRSLREAVESLRSGSATVEEPAPEPAPARLASALVPWRTALQRGGIGEDSLDQVLTSAAEALGDDADVAMAGGAVRGAMLDLLGSSGDEVAGERSTVVVGPSGAGKTTTIAKIAAERVAAGERPLLVCTDGESVTGEEELQAVAVALGLPFETAFLPGQLERILERDGGPRKVLVDTPARSAFDGQGLDPIFEVTNALADAEILLVLSAATDVEEIRSQVDAWARVSPDRVVLTKLDELARPGRLVDLARALPIPVARVSFGRSARGACSPPGDPRVLARILATDLAVEATA